MAERGALLAGAGTVLAGTSFAATSLLTNYPFLSGQALRFAVGALVLAVILLWTRARQPRPTARELGLLALLAATGLVGFNLASLAALRSSEPAASSTDSGSRVIGEQHAPTALCSDTFLH